MTDRADRGAAAIDRYQSPRLVLLEASSIEPQPVDWLWPGRIALRKVSLIASDPGLGKSLVTIDWVARVTRAAPWPVERTPAPLGRALILSAEDDAADTLVPRLIAAGADLARVRLLACVRDVSASGDPFDRGFSLERMSGSWRVNSSACQIADWSSSIPSAPTLAPPTPIATPTCGRY